MRELAGAPIDQRAPGQPRWVSVDGLHLTLRFLGATPDERIPELAARPGGRGPGSGAVPHRARRGRSLPFAGPAARAVDRRGGRRAASWPHLAERLNDELSSYGWPRDERPFNAHLTLARTDGVPGSDVRARRLIELARDVRLGWQADRPGPVPQPRRPWPLAVRDRGQFAAGRACSEADRHGRAECAAAVQDYGPQVVGFPLSLR